MYAFLPLSAPPPPSSPLLSTAFTSLLKVINFVETSKRVANYNTDYRSPRLQPSHTERHCLCSEHFLHHRPAKGVAVKKCLPVSVLCWNGLLSLLYETSKPLLSSRQQVVPIGWC
ncbi:hypothetical protein QOT17_023711 [Balamuthia mandrillaris]